MNAPTQPLHPGTVVGGEYRIVAELSAGGMGAVYVADQLSTGRRRALKVMHAGLVTNPTMRDRFVQEARVGSAISSAHVVEVVGAGVDPALGVPWLAMELLEGQNLAAYVAMRGHLPIADTLAVLQPLCHALAAAHRAGVVHRDVKPENIFLARSDSTTSPVTVKVLDFGIAKMVAQANATATVAMGTPLWMAPEQSELSSNVSPATDVWPLGLLGYFMLTGKVYWRAPSTEGAGVPALMREILFEPLAAPSQRAAEQGVAELVPAGFDAWFASTVAREPANRYANASEALDAFCHLVAGGEPAASSQLLGPSVPPEVSVPTLPSPDLLPSNPLQPQPQAPLPSNPVQPLSQAPLPSNPVQPLSQAPPPSQMGVVAADAPTSKRAMWPLVVGGLLALLGIGAAVVAIALFVIKPRPRPPREPRRDRSAQRPTPVATPDTAVTAAPSAQAPDPPPDPTPRPRRGPKAGAAPAPSASTSAAAPPFDHAAAHAAIEQKRKQAQFACKFRDGPPAIAVTLSFTPNSTAPSMVTLPVGDRGTSRGTCVMASFYAVRIPKYSGKRETITTAVSF
ncbi:MAG: protein kinase [Polyangiaceae bacterium]